MKISFKSIITKFLILCILIYVGTTLVNQQKKIDSYDTNISYLNDKIKKENEYKTELMATKDNINSQEYIEKVAREKLNMYKPNEKVYVDIGN